MTTSTIMSDSILRGRGLGVSRREFNSMLAGFLASQALPASAQAKASESAVRRIDVHHHILPPEYVATMGEQAIGAPAPNRETPKWKVSDSLEAMDRQGITTAVVSVSAPGVLLKDPAQTKRLARSCNDFAAKMVADNPTRFGTFFCLPLPDVAAAMEEIKYAFDELKADGVGMMTNYADRYLGDPAFVPVFDELNRRNAVVYVHPTSCNCNAGVLPELPHSLIEFPHDSTRAVNSLMFSGTFSRCPNIRFIFSHAGGTVPFLATRIAIIGSLDKDLAKRVPEGVMPTLKKLYYDTASSANPITFAALLKLVTPKNVVLGTDFPFIPEPGMKATLAGIKQPGVDDADIRAIEGENAAALFTRIGANGARISR